MQSSHEPQEGRIDIDGELTFSATVSKSLRFTVFFKSLLSIYYMPSAVPRAGLRFDWAASRSVRSSPSKKGDRI